MVSGLHQPSNHGPGIRTALGFAAVCVQTLALAPSAWAQTVRVRALEEGSNAPVAGAIVSLLDSASRRVAQGLTNEAGRLSLRAPAAGRFHVRADRIGHEGVLAGPVQVTDTASITVMMPAERLQLPELMVTSTSSCRRRADGEETARVWEEVRKALTASQITSGAQTVALDVRRFRRYRTRTGSLRIDSTVSEYSTRGAPFVSPEPALLQAGGFIQAAGDGYQFYAPDARLLLSDAFLEDHCFRLVRPERRAPGSIGLGFEPASGRDLPDVRGVLWVDHASAELRELEFEFVNVPDLLRVQGLGGQVAFRRLPTGAWIVGDWHVRTPNRVRLELRPSSRTAPTYRDTVIGYVDEGAIVRPQGDHTVKLGEAAAKTRETTTVQAEVRGRVVSSDGSPVAGAVISGAVLDSVVRTGVDGRFTLTELPARSLMLLVRAVGYRPQALELKLSADRRGLDTTLTLSQAAQQLDSVVVTGKVETFRSGKLEEFERRRKQGQGKFLTRKELHDPTWGRLDGQIRRVSRVKLVPLPYKGGCSGGYAAAATFRPPGPLTALCGDLRLIGCFMSIYLDGALYYSMMMEGPPPDLAKFNPLEFEAVEVYRSTVEIPPEYNASGSECGVIVLWTRVG